MKRFFAFLIVNIFVLSGAFAMQAASANEQKNTTDEALLVASAKMPVASEESAEKPLLPEGKDLLNAYSSPARINVNGSWDLFITASYLYYRPMETGYVAATKTTHTIAGLSIRPSSTTEDKSPTDEFSFDYHSAFKVGLGNHFAYDNWTSTIEYMRLHCDDTNRFYSLVDEEITPLWWPLTQQTLNNTKTKVAVNFDIIDWSLARTHYMGTKLIVSPYLDLRGGWIKQSISQYYYEAASPYYETKTKGKSHSWLVGPRLGCDANLQLGAGFKIIANTSAALLYQNFHTSLKYFSLVAPGTTAVVTGWNYDAKRVLTPEVAVSLGLGYGTYFDRHNWHIDLSASYDFDCFFNQNQLSHLNTIVQNSHRIEEKAQNLLLQGLDIRLTFDF